MLDYSFVAYATWNKRNYIVPTDTLHQGRNNDPEYTEKNRFNALLRFQPDPVLQSTIRSNLKNLLTCPLAAFPKAMLREKLP